MSSTDHSAGEGVEPSIFSRIIDGEIPGDFVWRDHEVVAFLTIGPIRTGHTMVVPVQQVDHWIDVPSAIWARMAEVQLKVGAALMEAFSPARVATVVLGMEVPHCHVHLVPIDHESDLSFANADLDASPESRSEAAEAIRTALRDAGHSEHVPD